MLLVILFTENVENMNLFNVFYCSIMFSAHGNIFLCLQVKEEFEGV